MLLMLAAALLMHAAAQAQTERRIYTRAEQEQPTQKSGQTERRIYTQAEQTEAQQRELDKELQRLQDSIDYANALESLEKLDFVVEADKLVFKYGDSAFVNSTTNFVSLSDSRAVVQIAPFNGGGPNGVGGITLQGLASNIKIKTDRRGNTYFTFNVMGAALSANVSISMAKGSNYVSVTVDPTFSGNHISFYGRLVPMAHSKVYEGRSL